MQACEFHAQGHGGLEGAYAHFSYLSLNVEEMFLSGEAQYPVERTLLTSGILEAALTSRYEGYKRLETPWLDLNTSRMMRSAGDRPDRGRPEPVWIRGRRARKKVFMTTFQDTLRLAHRAFEEASGPACHTLAQLGFDQPYQALRRLDLLVDLAGPAYALYPPVSLLAAVSQSVQPDQSLRRLERFLQRAGGVTALDHRTKDVPILGQQLAQILGYSGFLTDVLMRDPAHLYWLLAETTYLSQPLALSILRRALFQETDDDDPLTALYRFQRRELLRLGAAQVLGVKDVRQVGRELADLADGIVDQA